MEPDDKNKQDHELEQTMKQHLLDNFSTANEPPIQISDERLKIMNKKLPSWSLEPPFSLLK